MSGAIIGSSWARTGSGAEGHVERLERARCAAGALGRVFTEDEDNKGARVVNAGAINRVPFTNVADATFYWLEGQPRDAMPKQVALMRNVSRDYFATGHPIHRGPGLVGQPPGFLSGDQQRRKFLNVNVTPLHAQRGRRTAAGLRMTFSKSPVNTASTSSMPRAARHVH
jgi:hypothetical protein